MTEIEQALMFTFYNTSYIHGDKTRLHLGKDVYLNNTLFNTSSGEIYVGDKTMFAHNCMVLTGTHIIDGKITLDHPDKGRDIRIGENCWIGSGAIINGKVTIGDNTVIGAGSVVTKNIPANVFAVGNPAGIKRPIAARVLSWLP